MFSRFFIYRPIFATVLSIILIIAGLLAMFKLPVQQYPSIAPPQITVQAIYPGADARTLASTVSTILEEAINGVDSMIYMSSTASPNGVLSLNVYFEVGTDIAQAKVDVNNRVQLANGKLPAEVIRQGISVKERSPDMVKVIAFTSKNGLNDSTFISNYLSINVMDELKRISGIGEAIIFGQKNYAMQIWIDPDKVAHYGMVPTDITQLIRSQNAQYATGTIAAEPMREIKPFTYSLTTKGRLKTITEFEDIIIRSNPDGSTLKLKDIAEITIGADSIDTMSTYNGEDMMPVGVFLAPGANALEVAEKVDRKLEELSKNFPEGLEYNFAYDATLFVNNSIDEVIKTLIEAVVFVTILVYLFLGNFRATLIPMLAIPVSILGTFAGLYIAGFSINLLTLFGLILAIGLVVDDAIIVVENVERILKTKAISVKDATVEAMKELTAPLVAIVLVLSAVFIPAAFTGGFTGVMYQQFAITIVIAVSISGIVALTLTPALCPIFLKDHEAEPIWPIRKFNQFFDWLTIGFVKVTKQTIRLWFFSLALFAILLYSTVSLLEKIPTGLVPNEDQGVLFGLTITMPSTSMGNTYNIANNVADELRENPNVKSTGVITGLDLITSAYKSDSAVIFASLTPWDERTNPDQSAQALADKFKVQFMQNKDAFVILVSPPPIMGMSTTGGFEMWIQDRTGQEIQILDMYVKEIVQKASEDKRLTAVRTTLNANVPQYLLEIDRPKAKSMGIKIEDIFTTIQSTIGKGYINDLNFFGRTFRVNIQSESKYRSSVLAFKNTFVRAENGSLIPMSELVKLTRKVDASVIQRFNMFTSAQITGSPALGFASSDATDAIEEISKSVLPDGYSIAWGGTTFQEKRIESQGNYTSLYAIIFVFLILAALYESWSIPLAVIISIPFAIFGAAVAVLLRNLEADIYFQVGLVTLVGLSAKNAILIVEFAMEEMRTGKTLYDATIEAARLRFRPIVMTSLAFIAGTIPLALSTGAGSASRHIIGTTVVGGMIAATVIGVLFIPLFFYIVMKIKGKLVKEK